MRRNPPIPGNGIDLEAAREATMYRNMAIDSLFANASGPQSRAALTRALGYEYQGDRDIYTALGYSKTLLFTDYFSRFRRGDIAKRIMSAPVQETWKGKPEVQEVDSKEEETQFEKAWHDFTTDKKLRLWHFLKKVDLISGIGRYGVLFLGFDDAKQTTEFAKEVQDSPQLAYVTPLTEENARITKLVNDPSNERHGLPEQYTLRFANPAVGSGDIAKGAGTMELVVHWSRIIHVAEGAMEDEIYGTPRLEAVYNKLIDLERTVGSTGEGFWRNAFPGMQFDIQDDFGIGEDDLTDLRDQVDKYIHRMERVLRTSGVKIIELASNLADPTGPFEVIISVIAGTTGIPKRILIGSERGELGGDTDQENWNEVIKERREDHVNTVILDQLIQRLVVYKVLPDAPKGWTYVWPDLHSPSEKARSEIAGKRTDALVKYADSVEAGMVIPFGFFLRSDKFLGFSEEEAEKIEQEVEKLKKEKEKELEEENAEIERQLAEERAAAGGVVDDPLNVDPPPPPGTTVNMSFNGIPMHLIRRGNNQPPAIQMKKQDIERLQNILSVNQDDPVLEEWEYLIHHIHVDAETGDEEIHHCILVDHLGNMYLIGHADEGDLDQRHIVIGLVEDQEVFYSDEEAEENGFEIPCSSRQL